MNRWKHHAIVPVLVLLTTAGAVFAGPVTLPSPPQTVVNEATSITWRFTYSYDYSAGTNDAHSCGRLFVMAMASAAGNTSADYRMFKQIRYNLEGDHCILATGAYESQHERVFTGACALIRQQPRLWNQLTAAEQHKMDLLMKAALVASAYTTSDFGNTTAQNPSLDGSTNLGRGWNPNFREGMIGGMIVSTVYFGGGAAADAILNNYDHDAFVAELAAAGLTNTHTTFTWKQTNPTSIAPTGVALANDIRNYRYMDRSLDELMEIYWLLTTYTYDKNVNTGLYGGVGINGGGKMVSGQAGLPNMGVVGMLHEFDGSDGSGPRSSIGYAYSGYRPNLINQIVLIAGGYWEAGSMADQCVTRMEIGVPDLFYKLDHGYIDYANGHVGGTIWMTDDGRDFTMTKSLWYDVMKAYHDGDLTLASAGVDVTAQDADLDGSETVMLDGTGSVAAAGASLIGYEWREGTTLLGTGPTLAAPLSLGEHVVTLTVVDSLGGVSSDSLAATVEFPPLVAAAGDDRTLVDADGDGFEVVLLDGSGSFSRDGEITEFLWMDGESYLGMSEQNVAILLVGTHTITLRVTDSLGNRVTDTVVITVTDTKPGDADGDGKVDIGDFVILKNNFGRTDAVWSDGDFTGDGAVTIDDFVVLKNNFGS